MHTINSLAVMSEAATINCTLPHAGFELFSLENITIKGITFMGCRDIKIFYASQFRFEKSRLLIPDQGSLVLNFVHNVTIVGSSFLGNGKEKTTLNIIGGSSIHLLLCTFSRLITRAVYSANSTIIIDSCLFENNSFAHSGNGAVIETVNNLL